MGLFTRDFFSGPGGAGVKASSTVGLSLVGGAAALGLLPVAAPVALTITAVSAVASAVVNSAVDVGSEFEKRNVEKVKEQKAKEQAEEGKQVKDSLDALKCEVGDLSRGQSSLLNLTQEQTELVRANSEELNEISRTLHFIRDLIVYGIGVFISMKLLPLIIDSALPVLSGLLGVLTATVLLAGAVMLMEQKHPLAYWEEVRRAEKARRKYGN
ncbi:hypothetical protein [uncultured Hyphomonas sp.]|uniref:hypothetical protein n=1 Tax=uncultured Hyphomonas sp. TaxID=225298 RepID=UPI002AAC2795|nr:hypothetical protein [uncultured Hyphomonas sp.]